LTKLLWTIQSKI